MRKACKAGVVCAAFGAGLLAATVLPSKLVLVLVAMALIAAGCSCVKNM